MNTSCVFGEDFSEDFWFESHRKPTVALSSGWKAEKNHLFLYLCMCMCVSLCPATLAKSNPLKNPSICCVMICMS